MQHNLTAIMSGGTGGGTATGLLEHNGTRPTGTSVLQCMSPRAVLLAATAAAATHLPLARFRPTATLSATRVHACSDMGPKRKVAAPKSAAAGKKAKAAPAAAAAAPAADVPAGSIVVEACKS